MPEQTNRSDIEGLLAERARFETWLAQLAAKAATMPGHVVERVRNDYQQRLDGVVTALRTRADGLHGEVTALESRVRELADELTRRRDARAEDELRAMVGEYDAAAWEMKAAEHDAGIGALEAEQAARGADHSRLQHILAEALRPSGEGRPAGEVAAPRQPTGATPAAAQRAVEPAPAAAPAPAEPEKRASPFDEIGFMRSVIGQTVPAPDLEEPSITEERRVATDSPVDAAPRAPTPSNVAAQPAPERRSIPAFDASMIPETPAVAPARASAPAMPAIETSPVSEVARTSAAVPDAARSLKCQECGWMNYPTEWYCEKCGGELAAF